MDFAQGAPASTWCPCRPACWRSRAWAGCSPSSPGHQGRGLDGHAEGPLPQLPGRQAQGPAPRLRAGWAWTPGGPQEARPDQPLFRRHLGRLPGAPARRRRGLPAGSPTPAARSPPGSTWGPSRPRTWPVPRPRHPDEGKMFKQVVDFGFFGLVAKLLFLILRGHPQGRAQLGLVHHPAHRGHPRHPVAPEHQDHRRRCCA